MTVNWKEQGEKDEQRTVYSQSGERWGERAETNLTANGERYKKIFIHTTSPIIVGPVILAVQVRRIQTSAPVSVFVNVCMYNYVSALILL